MHKVYCIALNTHRELVRSKVLYSILFFALLLVCVSTFFAKVTIGDQSKVIKNFGLFGISLFSVLFAVISGTALLYKELSKKTIYNILAKSVERWEFLLGKYLGMLATQALLIFFMGAALTLYLRLFEEHVDWLIFLACLHILLELCIICACAIFFSAIVVTPLLAGLFTLGVFIVGRSSAYLLYFIAAGQAGGFMRQILTGLYYIVPQLDKLNISNMVTYGKYAPYEQVLASIAYTLSYAGMLLVSANIILKRRDFN